MKKKRVLLMVVLASLFIFIGGIGFKITINIKKDKEIAQGQSEKIKANYEEFNELAQKFNEKNKNYLTKVESVYFTTLEKEEKNLIEQLNELNALISEMEKQKQETKEICKITFTEKEINEYCETIKVSLSTATEVFDKEVNSYNDLIEKYNVWQEENPTHKKLEVYKKKES